MFNQVTETVHSFYKGHVIYNKAFTTMGYLYHARTRQGDLLRADTLMGIKRLITNNK